MNGGRRASLLALLLVVMIAGTGSAVSARQNGKPVIGVLAYSEPGCRTETFIAGLRSQGYVEGKTMVLRCRHTNNQYAGLDAAAADLVKARPDVIVTLGQSTTVAAKAATQSIPIVMSISGEAVRTGLVKSLAQPGGNLTGVSYYHSELNGKRLELLKSVKPTTRRVALLVDMKAPPDMRDIYTRDTQAAAAVLGISIKVFDRRPVAELEALVREMVKDRIDAVYVMPFLTTLEETRALAKLAIRHRLPTMHWNSTVVADGWLMVYGADYPAQYRRLAVYVDRILKGANPAQMPVEQPMRLYLTLNLATARAMGLEVPESVRIRADQVIE